MKIKILILSCALLLPCLPAAGQGPGIPKAPRAGIGNSYKDSQQRAADLCARGLRAKRKAENETDEAKRARLYARAEAELTRSVSLSRSFDALLALGQVRLARGQDQAALTACTNALGFKPADAEARQCVEQAREKLALKDG